MLSCPFNDSMHELWIWLGIIFCLTQSAIFSGLNIALFSLGRMRLEAEAEQESKAARKILDLRRDSNLLLCTILWGNVSVNVLLALLTDSVLTGVGGFAFSTAGITFFGEIIPQAYFSRHALRIGAKLIPFVRVYQIFLYPVAKPCALILDGWIGPEGPSYYREKDLEMILEQHIREESEISATEGRGALNFLAIDDLTVARESNLIKEGTIVSLPSRMDLPDFPDLDSPDGADFLEKLKKDPSMWFIITDQTGNPLIVLDTPKFLSRFFVTNGATDIYRFCHRPIIVDLPEVTVDDVLSQFVVESNHSRDHLVDRDVVLYWRTDEKRILTGADIFGRLLHGIARRIPDTSRKLAKAKAAATPLIS